MEHLDPYIVIGTGRCGTSTTARLMHIKMGIYMGKDIFKTSKINPLGFYEDELFKKANATFVYGKMVYDEWVRAVSEATCKRRSLGQPWGFKDPMTAQLLGLYYGLFEDPKIIWCRRDEEETIKSLLDKCEYSQAEATEIVRVRNAIIRRTLKDRDHLEIDFTNHRTDEDIVGAIKDKWTTNAI
jgi:hypothetical protein